MFQVHLVCPLGESGQLVGLLNADVGVRNIVALPGSATRPDGDVIQFDLATDAANPVLQQLRDLGIVFISITTIPAAADVGVSLANQLWSEAEGSALQLLLNVGLLIIIGALAIRIIKVTWHARSDRRERGRGAG